MSMQKRCILPHPCNGLLYQDWTETDFFLKLAEEFGEVGKAFESLRAAEREGLPKDEGTKRWWTLMEECVDLQVAATSFMERCGCTEAARQKLMDYVNNHNARRNDGKRFARGGDDVG